MQASDIGRATMRWAPEKLIWGGGEPWSPFANPPPQLWRGAPGAGSLFPCFSCISHAKTSGTVTVCHRHRRCHCRCHCVTPKGGGRAPPSVVSRFNTSLTPPHLPEANGSQNFQTFCVEEISLWPLEPLFATPLCDIPSGCCSFTGPWTVTRSSLRMLRRVAAFCRPLRPVLLLVSFPRSRSPVVGVMGVC